MKIKKKYLTYQGFIFEQSFHPGSSFRFEFQSNNVMSNRFFQDESREVAGFFEVSKNADEMFCIRFLLWPYDMISDGRELEHISCLRSLNANALEIESRNGNLSYHYLLEILPTEISEEGWLFEFNEATQIVLGLERSVITAEQILSEMVVGDSIKFSVCYFKQADRELYEQTKFSKVVIHFASVVFPFLDEFRSAFVDAFGKDLLNKFVARKGYELDEG